MGYQVASVYLIDGRRFDHVTIIGGALAVVRVSKRKGESIEGPAAH
jgi:hypothetical protein